MALSCAATESMQKAMRAAARSDIKTMVDLLKSDREVAYDVKQMLIASGRWPEARSSASIMGQSPKSEITKKEEPTADDDAAAVTPGTGETPDINGKGPGNFLR